MSYFGDQIFDLRKKQGLSQEEFADRIGVSRQIVSRWENGVAIPRSTRVKIICDEFKISPDILFGTEESIGKNESHPVAKKRLKLMLKGIATILIILFILYVIYSIYKLCILNYIDNKFKEYDNWTNYYAEIKTYEEAELVMKYEIWYKDNIYKIVSDDKDDEENKKVKWINCNDKTRTEYNTFKNEFYTLNQENVEEFYKNGIYLKNFFYWIDDIKGNKLKLSIKPKIINLTSNENEKVLRMDKKTLRYEKKSLIPISYSYNDVDKITYTYFTIELNKVKDEDIEIKEDL